MLAFSPRNNRWSPLERYFWAGNPYSPRNLAPKICTSKPGLAWRWSCRLLVQQSVTPPRSSSSGSHKVRLPATFTHAAAARPIEPPVVQHVQSTLCVIFQSSPHELLLKSNSIAENPNKCQYPAGNTGRPCARATHETRNTKTNKTSQGPNRNRIRIHECKPAEPDGELRMRAGQLSAR